jgi:hypothetical protein
MTWYREEDADSEVMRLRFEDAQGQVSGPFDIEWPNEPAKRFDANGELATPDWKAVATAEAKSEAESGNSERAIEMLADMIAGNVTDGRP